MTNAANEYLRFLANGDLDGYISNSQEKFLKQLERFREYMDESKYKNLLAESYDGHSWSEAIDHFAAVEYEMCMCVLEKGRHQVLERMMKGAEIIENEPDPIKKRKFVAVYDALEKKLNDLRIG